MRHRCGQSSLLSLGMPNNTTAEQKEHLATYDEHRGIASRGATRYDAYKVGSGGARPIYLA